MGQILGGPSIFQTIGVADLRRNRVWILIFGIALIVLGMIAIGDVVLFTLVSVRVLGWLLLIEGIIEAVQAFRHRTTGHFFLHLLVAVLSLVVGFMLLRNTGAGVLALTLVLSIYFIVGGLFRITAAIATRLPSWGWLLFNGIITFFLGVLVLTQWPSSALWLIGLFVGIDLIVGGWSRVMLALVVGKIPSETA